MTVMDAEVLVGHIKQDMRRAAKQRNRVELDELKCLLALVANAEAVNPGTHKYVGEAAPTAGSVVGVGNSEVPRKALTLEDLTAVLMAEKHEIDSTLLAIDATSTYAAELREKLAVVQRYCH